MSLIISSIGGCEASYLMNVSKRNAIQQPRFNLSRESHDFKAPHLLQLAIVAPLVFSFLKCHRSDGEGWRVRLNNREQSHKKSPCRELLLGCRLHWRILIEQSLETNLNSHRDGWSARLLYMVRACSARQKLRVHALFRNDSGIMNYHPLEESWNASTSSLICSLDCDVTFQPQAIFISTELA